MEMVSAVKMRRALALALETREYTEQSRILLREITSTLTPEEKTHRFLMEAEAVESELLIVIASNRGLCGSYNSNVTKVARTALLEAEENGIKTDVIAIGRKAAQVTKSDLVDLVSLYEEITEKPSYVNSLPISNQVLNLFREGKYDRVRVAFTNFKTSMVQEAKLTQILPLTTTALDQLITELAKDRSAETISNTSGDQQGETEATNNEYEFEPNRTKLLDYLLPKLVEINIYQLLLESTASEHSSRMLAMKNATEASKDMVDDLNLEYNKARQAAVTREIAEIASGAEGLT